MSIFKSRYARTRAYVDAFAGDPDDPRWRTPATAAASLAAVLAGVTSWPGEDSPDGGDAPDAGSGQAPGWGEGWDTGWGEDAIASQASPSAAMDGEAWLERGDHVDAGVGGDEDFFYFIDGDSSLTID